MNKKFKPLDSPLHYVAEAKLNIKYNFNLNPILLLELFNLVLKVNEQEI